MPVFRLAKEAYSIYCSEGLRGVWRDGKKFLHRKLRIPRAIGLALRNRQFLGAFGLFTEIFLRRNFYIWYLRRQSNDDTIRKTVNGFEMVLNLSDSGLSRELLCQGTREEYSGLAYRKALSSLPERENTHVLEIGSNIGYFALVAAEELRDGFTIHAFEPIPNNVELLQKNVTLNGYESQVKINQKAVLDKPQTVKLNVAQKVNRSHVADSSINSPENIVDTLDVEATSIDAYLTERGLTPENVAVVRMDIQGAEKDVLAGMSTILSSGHPMVMFIETHPWLMDREDHEAVIEILRKSGFEIVHASETYRNFDVSSFDDDKIYHQGMELILRR